MGRLSCVLVLLAMLLASQRTAWACTYGENNLGTAVDCQAPGPVAATPGDELDAPGEAHNEGNVGVPAVYAAISDWGGSAVPPYTTAGQLAAGAAMNYVCAQVTCKAVLSAGGNVLPTGLPAGPTARSRFNATWSGAYSRGPALAVPWYATGGAADWQGNISAERSYSSASTSTTTMSWHYPTLWQSVQLIVPPGFSTLQVLLLDTVTLLGSMQDASTVMPIGARRRARAKRRRLHDFNSLDDPPPQSLVQWQWLEAELGASTADWLIVVGNDPMLSAADLGPNSLLLGKLLPMMQAAGASLYIGGRDPVAQHFTGLAGAPDVDVVVIGNGALGNTTQATLLSQRDACPPGTLAFVYGETSGFITLTFQAETVNSSMTVDFYGNHGDTPLYSFTRQQVRIGKEAPPPPPGGRYGVRSGLILVLVLCGVAAAGGGWCLRAVLLGNLDNDPDPEEVLQLKAWAAKGKLGASTERMPLLDPAAQAVDKLRFNTFSL